MNSVNEHTASQSPSQVRTEGINWHRVCYYGVILAFTIGARVAAVGLNSSSFVRSFTLLSGIPKTRRSVVSLLIDEQSEMLKGCTIKAHYQKASIERP